MEAHPYFDRHLAGPHLRDQSKLALHSRLHRIAGTLEGGGEPVATGREHVSLMGVNSSRHDGIVPLESLAHSLWVVLPELCRTLDVGEEERDGPRRSSHVTRMAWQKRNGEVMRNDWSLRSDSNRRPAHYECAALPTELPRQSRVRGASEEPGDLKTGMRAANCAVTDLTRRTRHHRNEDGYSETRARYRGPEAPSQLDACADGR